MSPAERLRREAHRLHRREPGALEALLELAEEIEAALARHESCPTCGDGDACWYCQSPDAVGLSPGETCGVCDRTIPLEPL
jgi:hypothetical protein